MRRLKTELSGRIPLKRQRSSLGWSAKGEEKVGGGGEEEEQEEQKQK